MATPFFLSLFIKSTRIAFPKLFYSLCHCTWLSLQVITPCSLRCVIQTTLKMEFAFAHCPHSSVSASYSSRYFSLRGKGQGLLHDRVWVPHQPASLTCSFPSFLLCSRGIHKHTRKSRIDPLSPLSTAKRVAKFETESKSGLQILRNHSG